MESLSQRFTAIVEPYRDELFAQAMARGGDVSHAEGLLQQALRTAFAAYAEEQATADFLPRMHGLIAAVAEARKFPAAATDAAADVMPADTWARLAAAVQLEAAKMPGGRALNLDSVLLSPDPLLAPRKKAADDLEAGGWSARARLTIAGVTALALGVIVTVIIATNTTVEPTTAPATRVATPTPGPGE